MLTLQKVNEAACTHEYDYVVLLPIQLVKKFTLQRLVHILNPYTVKNNKLAYKH